MASKTISVRVPEHVHERMKNAAGELVPLAEWARVQLELAVIRTEQRKRERDGEE